MDRRARKRARRRSERRAERRARKRAQGDVADIFKECIDSKRSEYEL